MMRRPGPRVRADPRPPERGIVRPPAVEVGSPPDAHRRIPHVPVGLVMPPGAVAIERRGIVLNRLGQVLGGSPVPFRSPSFRPPVESIPGGRVVDVRVGRRCSDARKRAFSGAQRGLPVFIHQVRSAAQNDELDLIGLGIARVTTVAGDRDAVFTRLLNLRPPGRPHQYGRTRVGAVLEWSAARALPTTGSLRPTESRRWNRCRGAALRRRRREPRSRPFWVRSRSPASNGIEAGEVSARPSLSREAVPSTTEMCAGGSGDVS